MPELIDFAARGKVKQAGDGKIIFCPEGTSYQLYLDLASGKYAGPVGEPVAGMIRLQARKVYTVPSGGGFVAPIFGPPKTIQGRVLWMREGTIVVRAGMAVVVELPKEESAFALSDGPIEVGEMVNVVALPGATFEWLDSAVAK